MVLNVSLITRICLERSKRKTAFANARMGCQNEGKVLTGVFMFRFVDALLSSNQFYKAKEFMATLSSKERTEKNLLQLARIHDHFGEIKDAIECYKHILKYDI
jgi:hypothetical protein